MCRYLQWRLLGYNAWSCEKMVKFISLLGNNLSKNTYLLCLLSTWIDMFYLHWHNVIQFLSYSTYG